MSSSLTINPNLPASRSAPTSPSTSAPASPKKSSSSPLSEWTQKLLEIRQESTEIIKLRRLADEIEANMDKKWKDLQSEVVKQDLFSDETCSTNSGNSDLSDSLNSYNSLDPERSESSPKKTIRIARKSFNVESKNVKNKDLESSILHTSKSAQPLGLGTREFDSNRLISSPHYAEQCRIKRKIADYKDALDKESLDSSLECHVNRLIDLEKSFDLAPNAVLEKEINIQLDTITIIKARLQIKL